MSVHTAATLLALLAAAHAAGFAFTRLGQPRVVGEILGGALLGPTVLGRLAPDSIATLWPPATRGGGEAALLEAASAFGLALLMLLSGKSTKSLLGPGDRSAVFWLASVGTAIPFAGTVALASLVPLGPIRGEVQALAPIVLVLGVAAAVTSIPVISRIFHDLGVLETRFARLVLGVAVLEDVALWTLLALATALARSAELPVAALAGHLGATLVYVVLALTLFRRGARWLERSPRNALARRFPLAWIAAVLTAGCLGATACGVSLVFGSFFAGLALAAPTEGVGRALGEVDRAAYRVFVPLYFGLVGYRLDFGAGFSLAAVVAIVAAACALKLVSVALGARLAGFRGADALNLAVATNARGGPGIVLASVASEAGIVNAAGYTALVLLAIVTSQAAGVWLARALRRDGRLLATDPVAEPPRPT